MQRGLLKWQSNEESSKMKYDKVLIFKREKTRSAALSKNQKSHTFWVFLLCISV